MCGVLAAIALVVAVIIVIVCLLKRCRKPFVHPEPSKPGPWTKVIKTMNKPKISAVVAPSKGPILEQMGGKSIFDLMVPEKNSSFRPPISTRLE